MKVEREIGGIALPFAAGVLVTAYAAKSCCCDLSSISFSASAAIFIALSVLLSRDAWKERTLPHAASAHMLIYLAIFGCGALSATYGLATDIELPPSRLEVMAERFGSSMSYAIESIPFQSPDTGALLKALLTGNRSSLSPAVIEVFRTSGASHILALSGLHLGIIYVIFSKGLALLGNGTYARRLRSCLLILFCGFYTLSTGSGPSISRAFIFILLSECAGLTGRYRSLTQILHASLLLQLIFSPLSILSVSFQLSYAAMAGIAYIFPRMKDMWSDSGTESTDRRSGTAAGRMLISTARWIWSSAALSISCQLTTGPLAYIYFGTFPRYFLLTNLLALPLTGILIPAAVLTLLLSAAGWCPGILIQATDASASLLIWILSIISTL